MADMNSCNFIGRLTRDSELKYFSDGLAVARFSLAVNRMAKVNGEYKEVPSYLNFSYIGKAAEKVHPYLVKGRQVAVESECRMDSYTDGNGQARTAIEFIVRSLQLIGGKDNGSTQSANMQKESQPAEDPSLGTESIPF